MNDSPVNLQPAIITNNVKLLMTFIDRVGFPVLAFLLMFWLVVKLEKSLAEINQTLVMQSEIMRDIKAEFQIRGRR